MIGLQRSTVSPCSSSISRSTPWVLGCCGPMLMIIVWSLVRVELAMSPSSAASASLMRSTAPTSRSSSRGGQLAARACSLLARSSSTVWIVVDWYCVMIVPRRPLNCTGMRADLVVLAQRVALPVLRHQDAGEVGVAVEHDAEHVEHLALHRLGAGVDVEQRRHRGVVGRAPARAGGCGAERPCRAG